jgi:hypothetical protein
LTKSSPEDSSLMLYAKPASKYFIPATWSNLKGLKIWWFSTENIKKKKKLHGLSLRANYTDRATAACRRSDCQLLRIEGPTWSSWRIPTAVFSIF